MPIFQHPEKWREGIDPFALSYRHFQPLEILGYPHARNDVFHMRGVYEGREIRAYVKSARVAEADLEREARLLEQLESPVFPHVLDADFTAPAFVVTQEIPGRRLSVILGDQGPAASMAYMEEYGASLAKLHQLRPACDAVKPRRFFLPPDKALLEELGLTRLADYFACVPQQTQEVFCHGDYHYANLLWEDGSLTGVLDFELAGYGNRDFDVAWAIMRRPGQRFLSTDAEVERFLSGYAAHGKLDEANIRYYLAQCYIHFLRFCGDEAEWSDFARTWLKRHIG